MHFDPSYFRDSSSLFFFYIDMKRRNPCFSISLSPFNFLSVRCLTLVPLARCNVLCMEREIIRRKGTELCAENQPTAKLLPRALPNNVALSSNKGRAPDQHHGGSDHRPGVGHPSEYHRRRETPGVSRAQRSRPYHIHVSRAAQIRYRSRTSL